MVVIDPKTGALVSTEPASKSLSTQGAGDIGTMATMDSICAQSYGACYFSGRIPYANIGLYGTPGQIVTSMPYRSGGYSGAYLAYFCWDYEGTERCALVRRYSEWRFADGKLYEGTFLSITYDILP